ncbi:monoheme cytochrome C [Eudoraea chungangensis]|uniref:monoheme cytochrome C n=1 Tax=Eudoraea chungangensis TaxID=1481905 RepID=UPI0023EB7593|nr:monoheme cytochrome C [Eudoraea chungangensis]
MNKEKSKKIFRPLILVLAILGIVLVVYINSGPKLAQINMEDSSNSKNSSYDLEDPNRIENGIHLRTGLKDTTGLMTVVNNCTSCHSAEIIMQNRMSKEGWASTIKWMQETQNLWDLGENEVVIINYLATNYPPTKKGRREVLKDINWYKLEEK